MKNKKISVEIIGDIVQLCVEDFYPKGSEYEIDLKHLRSEIGLIYRLKHLTEKVWFSPALVRILIDIYENKLTADEINFKNL